MKRCKSCGKILKENQGRKYCDDCSDESGYRRRYGEIVERMAERMSEELGYSRVFAMNLTGNNMKQMPAWARKGESMKKRMIITDIGSTTTKAILLVRENDGYKMYGPVHAPTTVEKPHEDVMRGVMDSLKMLHEKTGQNLLDDSGSEIDPENMYLTTSSAGGGLQILVVGLTVFDSASSAKRASYGAGGVLLDVFAIDDKRSAIEQMLAMHRLFPDIILFSGGIDGGAVSGLVRLGELLSMAEPKAKFGIEEKVPLVFAGNKKAVNIMEAIFKDGFDLNIVPNLRPTMETENLQPACDKIHQLFMDHVMERAPGYSALKKIVSDDIIPTPTGVMKSMQILSESLNTNVMAVDIGGATTDVFSNILGGFYRTVSANYGMSYSIANVMKDASSEMILKLLPKDIPRRYVTNYVGNKMLFPTTYPGCNVQFAIELVTAAQAIRMSKRQHMEMHFNTEQLGILDRLKKTDFDKFTEIVYFGQKQDERRFHERDIEILIGAGGVIAAAPTALHALLMIVDGLYPEGVTEIWRDRHFTTPHLGKLSDIDEDLAKSILLNDCYEKLATVITPLAKKVKTGKKVMTISITGTDIMPKVVVAAGELRYLDNPSREKRIYRVELDKNIYLQDNERNATIESELPVLIDARFGDVTKSSVSELLPLDVKNLKPVEDHFRHDDPENRISEVVENLTIELPYPGDILVKEGDLVRSDTLVGEILYDPPRIFIVSLFNVAELDLSAQSLGEYIQVKEGDKVEMGQNLIDKGKMSILEELKGAMRTYQSPVRGVVERINHEDGTIIMREIQDYSKHPTKYNIAARLGIKPNRIKGYLKKQKGDYIHAGETIAKRILDTKEGRTPMFVNSSTTGTITDVDLEKGVVTVQYIKEPYRRYANLPGKVIEVKEHHSARIQYRGRQFDGVIGFGGEAGAALHWMKSASDFVSGLVNVWSGKLEISMLHDADKRGIAGLIAPGIDFDDINGYLQSPIGVGLTGNENIPFPIVLTEGFGDFRLSDALTRVLRESEGKHCYLNGMTQIRAGVVRPVVVIV